MPTVLYIRGWRLFFYSNEGNEPIHIHCQKGEQECKYWLEVENYQIKEAYSFKMNNKDKREIKKIIYQNFDEIVICWHTFFGGN
jgi:hypothetical protein